MRKRSDEGTSTIDGICLVTQASNTRLTAQERYVFTYVLEIFGMNISENMFALITFGDDADPAVLPTLKEQKIKLTDFFTFNNSVLFSSKSKKERFNKMFWEIGRESFERFFRHLAKTQPKMIKVDIDLAMEKRSIDKCYEDICDEMRSNEGTTGNLLGIKRVALLDGFAMNCVTCKSGCHCPCDCPNQTCKHIIQDKCTLCSGKCPLSAHAKERYK